MSAQSTFGNPTQYRVTSLTIDGQDVIGLFYALSIYENLYIPAITGNVVILDTDGSTGEKSFIEEENIEWIEPIAFTFENANGDSLEFEGVLNGLRNESVKGQTKVYTCEFTSKSVRKNEQTFVTKSFKQVPPETIVQEMIEERLEGKIDSMNGTGQPMFYLGSRKRPVDVIKYVITHGVPRSQSAPEATNIEDNKTEEAKGDAGFLCWETLEGFRFSTITDIISGRTSVIHSGFETSLANRSKNMDEAMKGIIECEFQRIGDFQTKLRSGAFGSMNVSYDPDTGEYKEYYFHNDKNMTEKQKEAFPKGNFSRVFMKPVNNQKFDNTCKKAYQNTGDQSRLYLEQNAGSQNTFCDQIGSFTLPLHPEFHAGDIFECKINKVKDSRSQGGADQKHSGKYVMEAVSHHLTMDGRAYTRVKSLRTTKQQNDASSNAS